MNKSEQLSENQAPLKLPIACLVVDPSPASRLIVQRFLDGFVERVDGVGYVQDATQLLYNADKPDLVLAAWEQAELSGLEFVRFVSKTTGVPAIVISSKSDAERERLAQEAGASGLITRPFSREQLRAVVIESAGRGTSCVSVRRQGFHKF